MGGSQVREGAFFREGKEGSVLMGGAKTKSLHGGGERVPGCKLLREGYLSSGEGNHADALTRGHP